MKIEIVFNDFTELQQILVKAAKELSYNPAQMELPLNQPPTSVAEVFKDMAVTGIGVMKVTHEGTKQVNAAEFLDAQATHTLADAPKKRGRPKKDHTAEIAAVDLGLAAVAAPETVAKTASVPTVTLEMVKNKINELVSHAKTDAAKNVILKHGGVAPSKMDPSKYAAVFNDLSAL